MKERWNQAIGLVILLAAAGGVYWLFRGAAAAPEQAEAAIETVVPVQVGHIERRTLHGYVRAYGSVIPDPGTGDPNGPGPAALSVTATRDGQVTEVDCRVGQQVRQGQALFQLYDQTVRLAVAQAEKDLAVAQASLKRQQQLKASASTSDKLFLEAQQRFNQASSQLQQARAELALHQVTAPQDGVILAVQAREGQTVTQADSLATLVDLDRLVVQASVPNTQAQAVHRGQAVEVWPAGTPDANQAPITGRVVYVDSQSDPDNGTVAVLTTVPAGCGLRNGQFVHVRITVRTHPDCLAVPAVSVVTTPEGQTVVALVKGDEAVQTPVQRGLTEGAWVEISGQGLQQDRPVVTTGAYGLPGRTKIQVMAE